MYDGNPNRKNPYLVADLAKSPLRGVRNPFHFGSQRLIGKLAIQPNLYGYGGGTNSVMPAPRAALWRRYNYPGGANG